MTIYRNQAMNWTLDCLNFLFEINMIGSTTLYLARPQRILLALVGFVVACICHQLFPCLRRQRWPDRQQAKHHQWEASAIRA